MFKHVNVLSDEICSSLHEFPELSESEQCEHWIRPGLNVQSQSD